MKLNVRADAKRCRSFSFARVGEAIFVKDSEGEKGCYMDTSAIIDVRNSKILHFCVSWKRKRLEERVSLLFALRAAGAGMVVL